MMALNLCRLHCKRVQRTIIAENNADIRQEILDAIKAADAKLDFCSECAAHTSIALGKCMG